MDLLAATAEGGKITIVSGDTVTVSMAVGIEEGETIIIIRGDIMAASPIVFLITDHD
jgi:hypothetical protein